MKENIRQLFITEYEKNGLHLDSEAEWKLEFKTEGGARFVADEEDLRGYTEDFAHFSALICSPNECSIASSEQIECRLRDLTGSRAFYQNMNSEYVIGESTDNARPLIKIGNASRAFRNYFRFNPVMLGRMLSIFGQNSGRIVLLRDRAPRYKTISVSRLAQTTPQQAVSIGTELIDSALFEMAALRDRSYILMDEWPKLTTPVDVESGASEVPLALPRASFSKELVSFYKLAIASELPELKFLALYQILEFFYLSVSDQVLYERLTRRIIALDFRPEATSLDRIIQDVTDHRKETDETVMLRLVLQRFLEPKELSEWIETHERRIKKKVFTTKRAVFGTDLQITLHLDQMLHTTSRYIKTIRNAIVHSSDRHERSERHIPFSQTTEVIQSSIPLLKFLAEKVIYGSARV